MSILHSFLLSNNIPLCEYTTFCLSIHQLMGTWVVSIFLAVMNNAAINIHVQVFMSIYVFISLGYIPKNGIVGTILTLFEFFKMSI